MDASPFKPGITATIIIAICILIFTLLFIFAKRQIMRFAQKFPTDGPHAPIGTDAPKKLVEEIQRRLDIVREIRYEPRLINEDNQCSCEANISRYKHIYRMKAIDALKTLEDDIVRACGGDESVRRPPGADLRVYLLNLRKGGYCPLQGVESKLINEFVEAYSNARSDPIPDFGAEELERYLGLLRRIQAAIISTASTTTAQQSSSRHLKETKVSPTKSTFQTYIVPPKQEQQQEIALKLIRKSDNEASV